MARKVGSDIEVARAAKMKSIDQVAAGLGIPDQHLYRYGPHKAKLALYQVHAVTEGTDAQAEVSVRLEDGAEEGGRAVTARAADPDTLVASAKAYLSALNKLLAKRGRLHAQMGA